MSTPKPSAPRAPDIDVRESGVSSLLIDAERFPRAAAFLRNLPEGLASYPECHQKASLVWALLDGRPMDVPLGQLPSVVADVLRNPPPPNVWLPLTIGRMAWLAVLDMRFPNDDAAALEFADRAYDELARSPMYALLLRQLSPSVVCHGAAYKWRVLYRGIELDISDTHTHGATGILRYPLNAMPRFNALSAGRGLSIALRMSRARNARVAMVEWTPTRARYEATWNT